MGLRLPDAWVWEFWFAVDGPGVHVFFLHAPRALGDPELRHRNARIGHAASRDLHSWELLPPPVTEADPRWYEKHGPGVKEEAWRDPWGCFDEDEGLFHMLVTARANFGPTDGRGVIGQAVSAHLRTWQVAPPLSEPGENYALEVPQVVELGDGWRLLFSAPADWHRPATAETGTYCVPAAGRLGPYRLDRASLVPGAPPGSYAGRLLQHQGRWHYFAWRGFDDDGQFLGELPDPMAVTL